MATRLAALKRRAAAAGVPCIYVNDNFGQFAPISGKRSRTAQLDRRPAEPCHDDCGRRLATISC